ncbi:MAG: monofunctional biosynthetic peptidoglycan transglycosylase [Acidiferrobacterales bacterium]|nr:monofunctional biosynthetic peptidoglycan transglycosylase [Acidiferrobacterales bacterium]
MAKKKHTSLGKTLWRKLLFYFVSLFVFIVCAITSLRWIDPLTSSVMLQQNIKARFHNKSIVDYQWVPWEELSPQLALAVVASEDQRFPKHHGIDFTELRKVIRSGDKRGASTITQQVAKNMFLWQGRSYVRKGLEAIIAPYIDLVWGKQRVLEVYLNIVYFGSNTYGAEAASKRFFNKPAAQVNRYEAARMAAVLPSPRRYSVNNASSYILDRQNWILRQMKRLGGTGYVQNL